MAAAPSFIARDLFPVTPSDSVVFDTPVAIKCTGVAGSLVVDTLAGRVAVNYPIKADETLNCLVTKVYAASTATILWALEI